MKADSYRFDGSGKCRLDKLATNSKADGIDKEKILAMTAENLQKMAALQDAFYADGSSFCRPWTPPARTAPSNM